MKDYYKILQVPFLATQDMIRQAYMKLSKAYHPDVSKHPKGHEYMTNINEAYDVLFDEDKRKSYDRDYLNWLEEQENLKKKSITLKKDGVDINP